MGQDGDDDDGPSKEDYQQQSTKLDKKRPLLRYSRKQLCVLAKSSLSQTIPLGLSPEFIETSDKCIISKNVLPWMESIPIRRRNANGRRIQNLDLATMVEDGSQSSMKTSSTRSPRDGGLDLKDEFLNEESFKQLSLMPREKQGSRLDHEAMMMALSSSSKIHNRQASDKNRNIHHYHHQKPLSIERKNPELALDLKNFRLPSPRPNIIRKAMPMAQSETNDENVGSPFGMGQTWGRRNVKTDLTGLEDEMELGKWNETEEEKMPEWMKEEESLKLFDFSRSTQAIEKEHLKYKATWFKEEPSVEIADNPCKYRDEEEKIGTRTITEANDGGTY
jgi:hypothetical protein